MDGFKHIKGVEEKDEEENDTINYDKEEVEEKIMKANDKAKKMNESANAHAPKVKHEKKYIERRKSRKHSRKLESSYKVCSNFFLKKT